MVPTLQIMKGSLRGRNVLFKIMAPAADGAPNHEAHVLTRTYLLTDQTTGEEIDIPLVTLFKDKGVILENGQTSNTLGPTSALGWSKCFCQNMLSAY